ncbi:MAG: EAL domain-containing protein [Thermodesulfobacteriota bacterium]
MLKENVQPKIGHALVVKNPMIQNLRLITRLIRDSLNMGNFMYLKKEYSSKYMLQKLIIDEDVRTVFQPIVELNTLDIIGYEALARGINSEIVAEGIETKAEYETLKDLNIRYGQGYLFAQPSDKLGTIRREF